MVTNDEHSIIVADFRTNKQTVLTVSDKSGGQVHQFIYVNVKGGVRCVRVCVCEQLCIMCPCYS